MDDSLQLTLLPAGLERVAEARRVPVPRALLERAGLAPGDLVCIECDRSGRLHLAPVRPAPRR